MFSNQKVNLHGNNPVNGNMVMTHEGRMIMTPGRVMTTVVRDDEWMIGTGIVVTIIGLIRDETSHPEMRVEAFHPEIGVKLLLGETDCLISSGKK